MCSYLVGTQSAVEDAHFVQLPFEGSEAVVAAAEEKLSAAGGVTNLGLAADLRVATTIEIDGNTPTLTHKDHVVPCPRLQNGPA